MRRVPQVLSFTGASKRNFGRKEKNQEWWHVLVHNFGSVRWILISLRQFRVKASRIDMVQARVPTKFIEDGKWLDQGPGLRRFLCDFFENWDFENFMKYSSWWRVRPWKIKNFLRWREFHCLAAPRFVFKVACRDDPFIVSRIVQAIFSFTGASKRNFRGKEKIKSGDTFWSITLVLPDGFRYRCVNAELKHQGLIWSEPLWPQNLLRRESGRGKVRGWNDFCAISWKLGFRKFHEILKLVED